jgi:hypothetical protein
MTETRIALLPDRGVVAVTGEDAAKLLQGVVTNDMAILETEPALHAGLLSPQGKILFDFLVVKAGNGFRLDTARDKARELAQRLALYKLRAKVEIADVSPHYTVAAIWGGPPPSCDARDALLFPDPRLAALGHRCLVALGGDWVIGAAGRAATQQEYAAHRIALGVPEAGKDFALGDTYPHEALYDQLAGVSFKKGCYVGQEVVSRMQHRGTARKRVVIVVGAAALPAPGTEVRAGETPIGTLGSADGRRGLALLRLDRAVEMRAKGAMLEAAGVPLAIEIPAFATFALPALGAAASSESTQDPA